MRELEARFPSPTLFRAESRPALALGMWTIRTFFQNTVTSCSAPMPSKVPEDFVKDREKLCGSKSTSPP